MRPENAAEVSDADVDSAVDKKSDTEVADSVFVNDDSSEILAWVYGLMREPSCGRLSLWTF